MIRAASLGRPFSSEPGGHDARFSADLPVDGIMECLKRSPGHEVKSGKMDRGIVRRMTANAFGWFLNRASDLPPLPGVPAGRVASVTLEAEMRFPWAEGRHPWLDVVIETHHADRY